MKNYWSRRQRDSVSVGVHGCQNNQVYIKAYKVCISISPNAMQWWDFRKTGGPNTLFLII